MKYRLMAGTLFLAATAFAQTQSHPQPTPPVNDALKNELLSISNATWLAFQHQDMATMQSFTSPDFRAVAAEGIFSGEQLAHSTQTCNLRSFQILSPEVHTLAPNAAVLVYKAQQDYDCNGTSQPGDLFVSDVFTRKNSKWLLVVHTEAVSATPRQ
jgi:hypothetical protein